MKYVGMKIGIFFNTNNNRFPVPLSTDTLSYSVILTCCLFQTILQRKHRMLGVVCSKTPCYKSRIYSVFELEKKLEKKCKIV